MNEDPMVTIARLKQQIEKYVADHTQSNGLCVHGSTISPFGCDTCWSGVQKINNELWLAKQRNLALASRTSVKHQNFRMLCGDPIEIEQFH